MLTGRKRLLLVREEAGIKVETVVAARTPYDSRNPPLPPSLLSDRHAGECHPGEKLQRQDSQSVLKEQHD